MDELQMNKRGVSYISRQFALLKGFRLVFNKKALKGDFAYANIIRDDNDFVEGILYNVTEEGIIKLDKYEGYPTNYIKKELKITTDDQTILALVYIAHSDKVVENLLPKREYLNHILAGKDLLSNEYFQRLENVKTLD